MPAEHKILKFILPKFLFEALKAGTKKWLLECRCGHKRDLWDAGGVKGGGTEQYTLTKCPQCGKLVKSDFSICPYCRTTLKTRCANCGKTVEKNWTVCPFCAKKL